MNPVKVKFESSKTTAGEEVIQIKIDVAKPWHIYANPVENEDLTSAATVVKLESKSGATIQVKYPPGTTHKDKLIGNFKAYEGQVTIPVVVKRDSGMPVEISVRYQACDETKCLVPVTVKHTLP
jgi:thiol:disulfide interchange protein